MIIEPKIRNAVCLNAHPEGCKKNVDRQIHITEHDGKKSITAPIDAPKQVLVIGCSNGYGLASRITAAFAYGSDTIGVSYEKAPTERKTGTPGWYHNAAFDAAAKTAALSAHTIHGDAFSDAIKAEVIDTARAKDIQFDLVIYSIASPARIDPETGVMYKSVIKPIGTAFSGETLDPLSGKILPISIPPADEQEIADTVKVMGGEDWHRWISQLYEAGALAKNCLTVAYSYIGPAVTYPLYRDGTIGRAKEHLEQEAAAITTTMQGISGRAFVSINKGVVTRASAVIPAFPLYLSALTRVLKDRGTHEGCIEQINRLFSSRLYRADGKIPTDEKNRIRIDNYELAADVQQETERLMTAFIQGQPEGQIDISDYRHEFLASCGFDIAGVDYN